MKRRKTKSKEVVVLSPGTITSFKDIREVILKVKKLREEATLPTLAHDYDACFDISSAENIIVASLKTEVVKTGIACEIPEGYYMSIFPRSGISIHFPNYLANSIGVIDSGYRNEIFVIVRNNSYNKDMKISVGDRIAQAKLSLVHPTRIVEVVDLSETDRGLKGLGSSGVSNDKPHSESS